MAAVGIVTTEIGVGTGSGIATGCVRLLRRRQIGMGEEVTNGMQNANYAVTTMNVASVREAANAYSAMARRRLPPWASHP